MVSQLVQRTIITGNVVTKKLTEQMEGGLVLKYEQILNRGN